MNIIHGTWIPDAEDGFIQTGNFYLWIETFAKNSIKHHLKQKDLVNFITDILGSSVNTRHINSKITTRYFLLPTAKNKPLPSPELNRYLEVEIPKNITLKDWQIECYAIDNIIKTLNDIHFIVSYNNDIQLGSDFLFWHEYTKSIKTVIFKDQYVPALKYRELTKPTKRKSATFEIHNGWQIISEQYENNIQQAIDFMPIACTIGSEDKTCYDKESLLRHFSEVLVKHIINQTKIPATFERKIANSLLHDCVYHYRITEHKINDSALAEYKLWNSWQLKLLNAHANATFQLGFQLQEAEENKPDNWRLEFLAVSKQDPSLKLMLNDY
ncbi:MAG: ATP-dependent helicase, partial [Proteobacteria bacterium]|nr:ATP-dependent helicase [Pseudomonadota bacterium]